MSLKLLVALLVGVLISTDSHAQSDSKRPSPDEIALGLSVYHKQYCGVCHTLTRADTRGVFGPPHDSLWVTAERRIKDPNYTGKAKTAADYIRESIRNPQVYYVPGFAGGRYPMPPYVNLSEAEVDALVALLLDQTKDDQPTAKSDLPVDPSKSP